MGLISLVAPTKEHKEAALGYINEHLDLGEKRLSGSAGLHKADSYEAWLMQISDSAAGNAVDGTVPSTTLFAMDENSSIVGIVSIRHYLNEYLLNVDGNIGYGVRPPERGKGYATAILSQALVFCRERLGLKKALLTCNRSNIASERVIVKNGGIYESDFLETNGNTVKRFWITL